jgi:glutamate synthase domain-containing protein 2
MMIMQYSTGRFGIDDKKLKKAAAVEIRFGQGAYPGKGSYLPADKISPEIAEVRGLEPGEPAVSPAHHPDIKSPGEVKGKVDWLRKLTGGVPIGAKIGCGNVEADVEVLVDAGVDYIALDGFGGGTGATSQYVRDNVGIPIIAALPRARRALDALGAGDRINLLAGGGLRNSADFAKCLALGADAVNIGTVALIAIGCQQYRVCHTGECPTGVNTNDPMLTAQLDMKAGLQRLKNFIEVSTEEIASYTRIVGKSSIAKLDSDDLVSMKRELAAITGTRWLDGLLQ